MVWNMKNITDERRTDSSALYYQDAPPQRQKARIFPAPLASLLEGMQDTILVINPETGLIEYANRAALEMFDCQLEDLIDHTPDIFGSSETGLKFPDEIIRASLKENGWEGEVRGVRKSGGSFFSWLRTFILRDGTGLPWMLVMVQAGLAADRNPDGHHLPVPGQSVAPAQPSAPGQLSAIEQRARETAHEFNNLASILYGYIDFMLLERRLSPELEKDLKTIQSISQKATCLARQFLNLARPQQAKKIITELAPLIQESLQIVSPQLTRQGIRTEVMHHQPATLLLDPAQISQVLINLYINAQHAMAGTSRKVLRIETGQDEGLALVKVSDTGCGIPDENQTRIFQPFFTTKGHNTGQGISGSGLGLAVARRIIEDHGGSIKVHSRAGEGTTITISLPLAAPDPGRAVPFSPVQAPKTVNFRGKMILIVDDEFSLRQLIKKALELRGARVDAVESGREGLAMIRKKNYDLILLDLRLKDMQGESLLETINSTPQPARPGKIVMSGIAGELNQQSLNSLGVSTILCKPFELDELYTKVSAALSKDSGQ
ncbi:MAG: ATP-binding protein [bacterium]